MASSQEDDVLKHVSHFMPSFPRFTRLPTELRWAIWDMSLPPRRFIVKASQAYLPRTLHVCRESRSRALSKGKLCYGNHDTGKNLLWINPSQDAVELSLAADQTPDPELSEHYPTLRHVTRIFVTTQFKIDAERDYKWDSPIMFLQHPWGRRLLNHADTMLICPRDVMCRPTCSPSLLWRRAVSRSMSSILIVHSYKHHTIRALFQEHDYLEIDLRQTDEITRVLISSRKMVAAITRLLSSHITNSSSEEFKTSQAMTARGGSTRNRKHEQLGEMLAQLLGPSMMTQSGPTVFV
ncbi:hypothetical protein SCUP234_11677 [Seiridium cupressi]